MRRVLKPGGVYCFRTPNLFHYVALTARLTPHWFHNLVANRLRSLSPESHDPYPTIYRSNSESTLRELARSVGFTVVELRLIEKEPSYGAVSPILFYPMLAYERFVNSADRYRWLRANIIGVFRKD